MATTSPTKASASQPIPGPHVAPLAEQEQAEVYRQPAAIPPARFNLTDTQGTPQAGDIPVDVDIWADFAGIAADGTTATCAEFAWDSVDLDIGTQVVAGDCQGNRCPAVVAARGAGGLVVLRLDRSRMTAATGPTRTGTPDLAPQAPSTPDTRRRDVPGGYPAPRRR